MITACANLPQPASVGGLSEVFRDPGFAVQGKTRKDQRWISETQETGIRVLGWKRPARLAKVEKKAGIKPVKPLEVSTPIYPPVVPPPPPRKWWQR